MDPIIKEKWLKALRSGRYQQHRGALSDVDNRDRLCCIGVGFAVIRRGQVFWSYCDTGMAFKALGINEVEKDALVFMNDKEGKSFAEIADYIEEHL